MKRDSRWEEIRGAWDTDIQEGSREAPALAKESAKSLPGREEWPGIQCRWTTLDWDRELRRDCVLNRDLGVKYGRG